MRFTLSWLRDHLATEATLSELLDSLTTIGLEVEAVDDPADTLGAFVIAEVVSCARHPEAERLNVCRVDSGTGETVQVVCGAPNVRVGMKAVFIAPGNRIPGTGLDLKASRLRGVDSCGMLCSERELEISDAHDGIIALPDDAPVGARFIDYRGLDDPVIEIALTPNRGDCASVRGIARDLAAAGVGTLKPLDIPEVATNGASTIDWVIAPKAQGLCLAVGGRSFSIDRNPPAPDWMQQRLRAVGLRPISTLVDITNYLTLDIGRPLHVFDADKLAGDTLTMRLGQNEQLAALNDKTCRLTAEDLVIADRDGVVSLAGVIGGEGSSCQADTRRVFLEAALFDPATVARTGRRHEISSDARYRFERGVDSQSIDLGLRYASSLIHRYCGGTVSETTFAGTLPPASPAIRLTLDRVGKIAGITLPTDEIIAILERLGCGVTRQDDALEVTPPSYRPDLTLEVCLIEEVLRIHGFDRIPSVSLPPPADITQRTITPAQRRIDLIRRRLSGRGLDEVMTLSFTSGEMARQLSAHPVPQIVNPINAEMACLRPTPLSGLLEAAVQHYDRRRRPQAIFQIAPGWIRTDTADQQRLIATGLRLGAEPHWQKDNNGGNDPFAVKADCLDVLELCGITRPQLQTSAPGHYHPHRSGSFQLGKNVLAHFGNLHPELTETLGFKLPKNTRIAIFEIFLDQLPPIKPKPATRPARPATPLQPLTRDLSFSLPDDYPAAELTRIIQTADKNLIESVDIFDLYQGKDFRAVAYRLTLQPRGETMTEQDLTNLIARIVADVEKKSPARIR